VENKRKGREREEESEGNADPRWRRMTEFKTDKANNLVWVLPILSISACLTIQLVRQLEKGRGGRVGLV